MATNSCTHLMIADVAELRRQITRNQIKLEYTVQQVDIVRRMVLLNNLMSKDAAEVMASTLQKSQRSPYDASRDDSRYSVPSNESEIKFDENTLNEAEFGLECFVVEDVMSVVPMISTRAEMGDACSPGLETGYENEKRHRALTELSVLAPANHVAPFDEDAHHPDGTETPLYSKYFGSPASEEHHAALPDTPCGSLSNSEAQPAYTAPADVKSGTLAPMDRTGTPVNWPVSPSASELTLVPGDRYEAPPGRDSTRVALALEVASAPHHLDGHWLRQLLELFKGFNQYLCEQIRVLSLLEES